MAPPSVFLSYNSKDAAFTERLEADLLAAGATVYRISAEEGGDFQARINDALLVCEWVVLVLTKEALASNWVRDEINAAIRLKNQGRIKGILPIQAALVDQSAIPPLWGIYNIFDATRDEAAAKAGVLRALGLASGQPPVPAQPKPTPRQHDPMKPALRQPAQTAALRDEIVKSIWGKSVYGQPMPHDWVWSDPPETTVPTLGDAPHTAPGWGGLSMGTGDLGSVIEQIEREKQTGMLTAVYDYRPTRGACYFYNGKATYASYMASFATIWGVNALASLRMMGECGYFFDTSASPPVANIMPT